LPITQALETKFGSSIPQLATINGDILKVRAPAQA
jgi:hypothetical protein